MSDAFQLRLKAVCRIVVWFFVWLLSLFTVIGTRSMLKSDCSQYILLVFFILFTIASIILLVFEVEDIRKPVVNKKRIRT